MNGEFLLNLKDLSIEIVVVSFVVFGLTMLIKWPIKKVTAKFCENKRKAINTVIVFIPMILALILNLAYFGIFENNWFGVQAFESAGSTYILATVIYAIYSRIVIVVKGAKTQNKTTEAKEKLSRETIKFIKQNAKAISKGLKVDEVKLTEVISKIDSLLTIRDEITSRAMLQDIKTTEKLNQDIAQLQSEEKLLRKTIGEEREQLSAYEKKLTTK